MKKLARFVIRPGPKKKAEIILGADLSEGVLKRNVIYEIREVLGELMIEEVGPCALWDCKGTRPKKLERLIDRNWGRTLNDIVQGGGMYLLTIPELEKRREEAL